MTGSNNIQYSTASVVPTEPAIERNLYSGGETEGWLGFMVAQGENNLILILNESANWEEDRYRYFAVDEGAKLGEKVITQDWEVQVQEVLRDEQAWTTIKEANQFNEPPAEGMEYVLALIKVRYIGQALQAQSIDSFSFKSKGSRNVLYDQPSVVAPEPTISAYLFPGGEYQGWVVLSAEKGEEKLTLAYQPYMDWDDTNKRFLSLEP